MSYQGAYQGHYAGFPEYSYGQPTTPQYHANGMQYPMRQQPSVPQQTHQSPIDDDIYAKQYYQAQQQTQYATAPQQQVQYTPQYPGYQQGQNLPQQYQFSQGGHGYPRQRHASTAHQSPSPVVQQRPQMQQRQQAPQYAQFQQQQARSQVPSQWAELYVGATKQSSIPAAQSYPRPSPVSTHPSYQTPMQRAPQVPRQAVVATSPVQSHPTILSSPDPLQTATPSIVSQAQVRQVHSGQTLPIKQQSRSSHTPVAVKPKANVIQPSNTPQHHVASHVEIPIMSQPAKRRRSNDGASVPVCEGPSVDYQGALLALSDEYIAAAYSLKSLETDEQLKEYHILIAAGIGCLESVLQNYRHHDARREARIRLRLATLLVEETENDEEAAETLSKGIALCERSHLLDLKYAMHHVLAGLSFKRTPKAALKTVDKLIQEVEALRLLHWSYAFRLLRVCQGMQIPGHSDTAAILKHLTAMSTTADRHRHISMLITVSTVEAMVYLRSGSPDAVDLARRALASARTHQLGTEIESMPQVRTLLDCLDLACSLVSYDAQQTLQKMTQMHASMDPATRQSGWSKNGSFAIPMLPSTNAELELDTLGIMRTTPDGTTNLNLRWMTQTGIYVIGYLLSGITYLHKDEEGKAQSFLREGLKLNKKTTQFQPQSLSSADQCISEDQQSALDAAARLLLIFDHCGRFEWAKAREGIEQTRIKFSERGLRACEQPGRTLLYLDAMCRQAEGDLPGALALYQSPDLAFEPDSKIDNAERDYRVLSALNSIMILRTMGSQEAAKANDLHNAIEAYCLKHQSKSFAAAFFMTKATANDSEVPIIKTKSYLHSAVKAAKVAANGQLIFIVMNVMTDLFFQSIIGEQAEKSAGAGRTLAKSSGDQLWLCVADNMYGEIKERCGKVAEANAARKEGMDKLKGLPEAVKRSLSLKASEG